MGNQGWRFPLTADPAYGCIRTTDYEDMIRQSIHMILSTRKGERFLRPEFGCDIHDFVFQGADYTTLKRVENEVRRSINAWENRISDLSVHASVDPENHNRINIEISYFVPKLGAIMEQSHVVE